MATRTWRERLSRALQGRRAPRRAATTRPRLEWLEGRLTPSVFTVNSLDDLSIAGGVNPDGTIAGRGNTVTLRSALLAADNTPGGNWINLALPGIYRLALPPGPSPGLGGAFAVLSTGGDLAIVNASGGAVAVDGGGHDRVLDISPDSSSTPFAVTFQGLTIQGGHTAGDGGGILNEGAARVALGNCTLQNNYAGGKGGGYADPNGHGQLLAADCLVNQNSAVGDGGGLYTAGPAAMLVNSQVQYNTSGGSGAGLFAGGGTLNVAACTFAVNTADGGGAGLEVRTTGQSSVENATFVDNYSRTGNGGGLDAPATFSGNLALTDDTVNLNAAAGDGGGVYWGGAGSTAIVQNTILFGNTAGGAGADARNPAGAFSDGGGNLVGVAGGYSDLTPVSTADPQLGPLVNNGGPAVGAGGSMTLGTEALLGGAALKAGVPAGANTDARGFARPNIYAGQHPDIGAFEYQDVTLALAITSPSGIVSAGYILDYVFTVTNTSSNPLPADNSMLTVTPGPAFSPAGPLAFAVGPLGPGQSKSFTVTLTATASALPPHQVIVASVTSNDAYPRSATSWVYVFPTAQSPTPHVSVAFGPFGQVTEIVNSAGVLTQIDAAGAHVLMGGVRTASVAFLGATEVLDVVTQAGALVQFDGAGGHVLFASGIRSGAVAFVGSQEVLDVINQSGGALVQYDAAGVHTLLQANAGDVGVAFGPSGEVLEVVDTNGFLTQYDASGFHMLGSSVRSADVAFLDGQEVLDWITLGNWNTWMQLDALGAHNLGSIP